MWCPCAGRRSLDYNYVAVGTWQVHRYARNPTGYPTRFVLAPTLPRPWGHRYGEQARLKRSEDEIANQPNKLQTSTTTHSEMCETNGNHGEPHSAGLQYTLVLVQEH